MRCNKGSLDRVIAVRNCGNAHRKMDDTDTLGK